MKRTLLALALIATVGGCVPDTANQPPPGHAATQPVRAYVGTLFRTVGLQPTAANGGVSSGARLEALTPSAPADAGGLKEGDIVVAIGDRPVADEAAYSAALNAAKADVDLPFTVIRGDQRMTVTLHPIVRAADTDKRMYDAVQARFDAERAAASEASQGEEKFRHYVMAYRFAWNLSAYRVISSDRGKALKDEVVVQMADMLRAMPAPPIPAEAERQNRRAITQLQSAKSDADNDAAFASLDRALYEAPWLSDLWANAGVVADKAGYSEVAQSYLNRYLMLVPNAPDAAAVRQKLAELDILVEERKPWLRYAVAYQRDTLILRGRTLTITSTSGSAPDEERRNAAGDILAVGTIKGRQFTGKWTERPTDPDRIRCIGPQYEVEAQGIIDAQNQFVLSTLSNTFYASTCAKVSSAWNVTRRYNPTN